MRFFLLFKNSYKEIKTVGLNSFVRKAVFYIRHKLFADAFSFEDEFEKWNNLKSKFYPVNDNKLGSDIKKENIYFLIPGANISGGIAVIFRYANMLLKDGYNVKILSLSNINDGSWFPNQEVEIISYAESKKILKSNQIGILIATAYSTAFTAYMANAKIKFYFVQSDESRFFPEDTRLCEKIKKTYELPFIYITEAKWIQDWLMAKFGHESYYTPNGIDLDIFKRVNSIEPKKDKTRILIEGAIDVSYKGMEDAYNSIKDLDCEIWIVSNNGRPKKGWRYDRFFENVPYGEMNKIYSSCDIFLKMSRIEGFFGPPMEAMACGCAVVVGKVTGYEEYIINGKNALVVEMGDVVGARNAIQELIENVSLRNELIKGGEETTRNWSWENSFYYFKKIIHNTNYQIKE